MSNSLWPHGLYSPWNSPAQNTGAGSLSLLQGIFPTQGLNPGLLRCRQILYQLSHREAPKVNKIIVYFCCCLVPKLCLTLWDPMEYSSPGSSVHRISQGRTLEWVAIPFSRGSSWPRDWIHISCMSKQVITTPPWKPLSSSCCCC